MTAAIIPFDPTTERMLRAVGLTDWRRREVLAVLSDPVRGPAARERLRAVYFAELVEVIGAKPREHQAVVVAALVRDGMLTHEQGKELLMQATGVPVRWE